MPDLVGVKLDASGRLLIRHREAAMHLNDNPEKVAKRYAAKFSKKVQQAVRSRFAQFVSAPEQAEYEKWVATFQPSAPVRKDLEKIDGIRICILSKFVLAEVLPTIARWRKKPPDTRTTQLPGDKWLLHMVDWFEHFDLISALPR